MTTQPQPEALPPLPTPDANRAEWDGGWRQYHDQHDLLPDQWDDEKPDSIVPLFTADQMRAYATEHAVRLHAECESLRADRDSWERQCSDRVDDAVEFLQQRDEARAELLRLHAECESLRQLSADRLEQITAHRQYALRWHDECEALQKRLNDATTPDMFWDASDPELYGNDVEELASEYDGGSVFRVDCAKRLPSFSIRVTGADGAYEHIDAARAAKEQQ